MLLKKIYCRMFQACFGLGPGCCPGAGRNASPEPAACKRLAELADVLGLCPTGSRTEKARAFIDAIFRMNRALGIPERFPCIRPEDLPQMAAWAEAEANPVYPVPVIFSKEDFIRVARRVMPCALAIKNEKGRQLTKRFCFVTCLP